VVSPWVSANGAVLVNTDDLLKGKYNIALQTNTAENRRMLISLGTAERNECSIFYTGVDIYRFQSHEPGGFYHGIGLDCDCDFGTNSILFWLPNFLGYRYVTEFGLTFDAKAQYAMPLMITRFPGNHEPKSYPNAVLSLKYSVGFSW
jgi:hypothetical protein